MLSAIEPPAITGDGEMNEIRELSVNKVKKNPTVNGVFICEKNINGWTEDESEWTNRVLTSPAPSAWARFWKIGLPCVTQTWRKPWKKLSPYWLNEWCNWQPKKNDGIICLRLWRGTYTQQCWIPMWILLWYSDSCFCDCLCVKSECPRDCQKKDIWNA